MNARERMFYTTAAYFVALHHISPLETALGKAVALAVLIVQYVMANWKPDAAPPQEA